MPEIKRKRRRINITGKYTTPTQPRIIEYLALENDHTIMIDDSSAELFCTPKKVRDKGIIVCSECGHYNSDSLSHCKFCHEQLIFIPQP